MTPEYVFLVIFALAVGLMAGYFWQDTVLGRKLRAKRHEVHALSNALQAKMPFKPLPIVSLEIEDAWQAQAALRQCDCDKCSPVASKLTELILAAEAAQSTEKG